MIKLAQITQKINSDNIKDIAKLEIERINPSLLPLQKGLTHSSYVGSTPFKAVILNIAKEDTIRIKVGIFYTGIIAGCSCSDDPSPTDEQTEYCELLFSIDNNSAATTVKLLTD